MTAEPTRRAEQRHGWWPGWIWSIPLAALGLIAWLAVQSLSQSGPTVTVIFPVIANLRAADTNVTFEGYKVGQVSSVQLESDLQHMRVRLDLDKDLRNHLGIATQFWIIGRSPSIARISDIKALIQGVSIGIRPAPGQKQPQYQGLARDPVLGFDAKGTTLKLHADHLGNIQPGTPIYYRGDEVGKVQNYTMQNGDFTFTIFIDAPHDQLVHDDSRFWRAGPIHLSTDGGGPSLQFQSVPALLQGAIAFDTSGIGPDAKAGADFKLYGNKDSARYAPDANAVVYRAVFHNASGLPGEDAAVMLMGKRVGSVTSSALQYDPGAEALDVLTNLAIEPHEIARADGQSWPTGRPQVDDMMRALVAHGLRAGLQNSPPVIGGEQVVLRITPDQPGTLGQGAVPELPTSPGGGVAGLIASAGDAVSKIDALPFSQIADHVQAITAQLQRLADSPAVASTLRQLDRTVANLQQLTGNLRHEVPQTLDSARDTLQNAQKALASAQDLLSSPGHVVSAPGNADLPQTLYEVTQTARALRDLSDYLDRHPSSLITGRAANE